MIPSIPVHTQISHVPFYSQFQDIQQLQWKKVGCGITSLAMVINYYKPDAVTVNALLKRGIASGAYDASAGWVHKGLISLSTTYGLNGEGYDLTSLSGEAAFNKLATALEDGPVIVSVHYKFDPRSKIPHLVVMDGIDNGVLYYNDPASTLGEKKISKIDFQKGWKKKMIVIRPVSSEGTVLVS